MKLTTMTAVAAFAAAGLLAGPAAVAQTLVTTFPDSDSGTNGVWFESAVTGDSEASIVGDGVSDLGPLRPGAALLTVGSTTDDKAEVGVRENFGNASDIFPTLSLSYWFFKVSDAGNKFAAPSIKLALFNDSCPEGDDCFGTLVYEPTWNGGGAPLSDCSSPSSVEVPQDQWIDVLNINSTMGCFWWTGGFGEINSGGGPPLRTLSEWASTFSSNTSNFDGAEVVFLSVGIGSNTPDQIGYFDSVEISHTFDTGFSRFWDFDFVPEFSCVGFDNPVGDGPITVRKNRVIPFKAELFDRDNIEVEETDVASPPVINISFSSADPSEEPVDVTDESLAAGQGTEGNAFTWSDDQWQFNLLTKNYTEAGTYTVTMVSGDQTEYVVDPTCTGTFMINE